MKGNEAIAEAAIQAECRFYAGYPITPQNEIPEYMSLRMPEVKGVFIQAESELAAINMVYGASAAGVRAMTSSSSPGISLKQEAISYLCGAELPAVIVNIQRGGPGLGNISASQADYFQATKGGGHGDYRMIVYAPATIQESWDLTMKAFDKADEYRNPAMILGDGILGQLVEPLIPIPYNRTQTCPEPLGFARDKLRRRNTEHRLVLSPSASLGINSVEGTQKKDWILDGCKDREPRVIRSLCMKYEGELEDKNWLLKAKYDRMTEREVMYECLYLDDASFVIIGFGIAARIATSAVNAARKDGMKVGLIRPITLFPFPSCLISDVSDRVKRFLVVEMNLGQMVEDVKLSISGRSEVVFYGRPGGGIPTPEEIYGIIKEHYAF
ncbi:MAG: 3-methyl-2-oxobutanoate dehydrogenase subunit beta [Nitrospirota bacterium]